LAEKAIIQDALLFCHDYFYVMHDTGKASAAPHLKSEARGGILWN